MTHKQTHTFTVSEFLFIDIIKDDVSETQGDDITQATAAMSNASLSTATKLTTTASEYVPPWMRTAEQQSHAPLTHGSINHTPLTHGSVNPDSVNPGPSNPGSVYHGSESDSQSTHLRLVSVDANLVYSIDVECVATGLGNKDRAPARAVLIDQYENVLLDRFIKPHSQVRLLE